MKPANKLTVLLIAFTAATAVAALWAAPEWIRAKVVSELRTVFKDAEVSVGPVRFERPLTLRLTDIRVTASGYGLNIPSVTVDRHLKLVVYEPRVQVRKYPAPAPAAPKEMAGTTVPVSDRKPAPFFPRRVEARGLTVEFKLPNLRGEVRGSAECDLRDRQVHYAHFTSPSLRSGDLKIEGLALDLPGSGTPGTLSAERLTLQKLKVTAIRGTVIWEDTLISVDGISAGWVKGTASGHARLKTQEPFTYSAELELRELDLGTFAEEFKLDRKMSAEGKLAGKMSVAGDRAGLSRLDGRFEAGAGGGDLVIRDENFLKYLADNTRQPMAIVEAAFKDYHYDTGTVAMEKTERKLGVSVNLNGAKGRRDFEIHLHDIL